MNNKPEDIALALASALPKLVSLGLWQKNKDQFDIIKNKGFSKPSYRDLAKELPSGCDEACISLGRKGMLLYKLIPSSESYLVIESKQQILGLINTWFKANLEEQSPLRTQIQPSQKPALPKRVKQKNKIEKQDPGISQLSPDQEELKSVIRIQRRLARKYQMEKYYKHGKQFDQGKEQISNFFRWTQEEVVVLTRTNTSGLKAGLLTITIDQFLKESDFGKKFQFDSFKNALDEKLNESNLDYLNSDDDSGRIEASVCVIRSSKKGNEVTIEQSGFHGIYKSQNQLRKLDRRSVILSENGKKNFLIVSTEPVESEDNKELKFMELWQELVAKNEKSNKFFALTGIMYD